VLRGGAFSFNQWNARCAYRFRFDPGDGGDDWGFRVALFPL